MHCTILIVFMWHWNLGVYVKFLCREWYSVRFRFSRISWRGHQAPTRTTNKLQQQLQQRDFYQLCRGSSTALSHLSSILIMCVAFYCLYLPITQWNFFQFVCVKHFVCVVLLEESLPWELS